MAKNTLKTIGVGIDLVDVKRFKKFNKDKESSFLKKVFLKGEVDYCFKYKDPSVHLAGSFAAKEAVSKALGVEKFPFAEVEIRHRPDGAPEAWHKGKKLSVKISITHTDTVAAAIATL